jgi:sporulation protein YlmC with PRC-barrel domain
MLLIKIVQSNDMVLQKAILNILSIIDYSDIQSIESSVVIYTLRNGNTQIQEYALNVISSWNAKEVIGQVRDVIIDHEYLQKRLNKIIARYEA